MEKADPRAVLDRLVRERREDYTGLSRIIGRNPAYVQQFIKRGVPRRLTEEDRRQLARYFKIPESLLGGPPEPPDGHALVPVERRDVGASAGPGAAAIDERGAPAYAFDRRMLRELTGGRVEGLSVIRVRGDSMVPTFHDGDDILVDAGIEAQRPRDGGVYVLRVAGDLVVKRLALAPAGFTVISDNPAYPAWNCARDGLDVVGRVIWAGRRVA